MRLVQACALAILTAACAGPPPAAFFAYDAAVREGAQATGDLVAAYEPSELLNRRVAAKRRDDFDGRYDPDEAATLGPLARGPVSRALERGFAALADYNATLALYASGASFTLIEPRLTALGTEAAALAAFAGAPQAQAALPAATGAAAAAFGAVAAVSDRARLAGAVRANAGKAQTFLAEARAATPTMFQTVATASRARRSAALRAGGDHDAAAERAAFRAALDAWVGHIDLMTGAADALEAAVKDGPGALSPEALTFWAAESRRAAEELRLAVRAFGRI